MRVFFTAVVAFLLSAVPAAAGIVNGSFSSGQLAPWEVDLYAESTASNNVVITDYAGSSNAVQLLATNTYTWTDEQWQVDQDDVSGAAVGQIGITLDAGVTALQFQAAALYEGPGAGYYGGTSGLLPSMVVSVTYGVLGSNRPEMVSMGINDGDWNSIRQIDLPGNVDIGKPAEVWVTVTSPISQADHDSADHKTITVTGYADNFAFVPEPASMAMLAVGALGMGVTAVLRRRRVARATFRRSTGVGE